MSRPVLTYVFDAYCGWCYGFGSAFAALVEHVGDRAEIRVLNGGLFIDDRARRSAASGTSRRPTTVSANSPA